MAAAQAQAASAAQRLSHARQTAADEVKAVQAKLDAAKNLGHGSVQPRGLPKESVTADGSPTYEELEHQLCELQASLRKRGVKLLRFTKENRTMRQQLRKQAALQASAGAQAHQERLMAMATRVRETRSLHGTVKASVWLLLDGMQEEIRGLLHSLVAVANDYQEKSCAKTPDATNDDATAGSRGDAKLSDTVRGCIRTLRSSGYDSGDLGRSVQDVCRAVR